MHVLGDVGDLYTALVQEDCLDIPPDMQSAVDSAIAQAAGSKGGVGGSTGRMHCRGGT